MRRQDLPSRKRKQAAGPSLRSGSENRIVLALSEARRRPAFVAQPVHVDVRCQQQRATLVAVRLGQDAAVLGDNRMVAEDEIGRRFLDAGTE